MVAGKKLDRALMHRNNTKLVLAAIRNAGEMSRAQAAEATGMSIVTVGRIADELLARGMNQSAIHEDVMVGAEDSHITGKCRDGRTVELFRDGVWVL